MKNIENILAIEYKQVVFSISLLNHVLHLFCDHNNTKCAQEIKNIIERLIICFINYNNSNTWSTIYYKISVNDPCIRKMIQEFTEKNKYFKSNKYINKIVNNHIIRPINIFVDKGICTDNKITLDKVVYGKRFVSYMGFMFMVSNRTMKILSRHPDKHVAPMILRYKAMLTGGQQWSIPLKQYNWLYTRFNMRFEGFASPLNSKMMGRRDAHFCSICYDTDKYFGSLGNFFKLDLLSPIGNNKKIRGGHIGWVINPPFTENLLNNSAQKVVDAVAKAVYQKKKITIFFIMPGWDDLDGYKILLKSPHMKYKDVLKGGSYYYESGGKLIKPRNNSFVFILDSYKIRKNYSNVTRYMKVYI